MEMCTLKGELKKKKAKPGEIKFNDIFHLTQYIQTIINSTLINIKNY